jgi:hypothetical protein
MLEQLETGKPFDHAPHIPTQRETGAEWLVKRLAEAERSLAYAEERLRKERDMARESREWLDALRTSVPQPEAAKDPSK